MISESSQHSSDSSAWGVVLANSETIEQELERNKRLVDRQLSDITHQSTNLMDGFTKTEEEGYTYQRFYGNKQDQAYGKEKPINVT